MGYHSVVDYYDFVRYSNVTMASVIAVLAIYKSKRIWRTIQTPAKLVYMAYIAFMAATVYGTIDSMAHDIPPSFRVSFTGGALVIGVLAYVWPDPDRNWMLFWYKLKRPQ